VNDSEHSIAAAVALAAVPFLAPLDPVDLAKLAGRSVTAAIRWRQRYAVG
jgi:hypothetical protein